MEKAKVEEFLQPKAWRGGRVPGLTRQLDA